MLSPISVSQPQTASPQPWPAAGAAQRDPRDIRILHLEDNDLDAALVQKLVSAEWPTSQITRVSTRFAYTGELQLRRFDLILSDFTLDSFRVREQDSDVRCRE